MRMRIIGAVVLTLSLLSPNLLSEIPYPWKEIHMGALDATAWAGLVIAPRADAVFAFRIRVHKEGESADGMDLLFLVAEVGPHSPDGQYARVKFDMSLPFKKAEETPILKKPPKDEDTLVFEWSRKDERTVIGRISAPKYITLDMIHYFPWENAGNYELQEDGQVKGQSASRNKLHYLLWTSREGLKGPAAGNKDLVVNFPMGKRRRLHFCAGVGDNPRLLSDHIYRYKNAGTIDTLLEEEQKRYEKIRLRIDKLYTGVERAITNNLFWMTLYQAGKHRLYTPAGRRWIFPRPEGGRDHWTIFEWDSFFNALELSVESFKHARDVLVSVLETQYPNGNIPNWRGRFGGTPDRSQPPVGSYVVLKYFLKSGDTDLLRFAYPILKKWHAFWTAPRWDGQPRRDGNSDGLLEWGSDEALVAEKVPSWEMNVPGKQRAMWESGQDDLPNWDAASFSEVTGTLTMNCLDLNSLYALDAWCLSQMANILGEPRERREYLAEYEQIKNLVNDQLWDEKEGFYFDRHWDGRFSKRWAASNFFPLLARIPDQRQAMRMIRHLLDDKKYWGDYVIPTISRDDPAFEDQQYWRGTAWPPTNYMVYQGLKAYGFDAVAAEFAKKSAALFLRTWDNFQLCPENFDSRSGEGGGRRYQSWGPLFALIALEEYLDFTPWEGFRFGMINPEKKGRLSRLFLQGRHYDVEVSRGSIKLKEEGREIVKTNGDAVFRRFLYSEKEVSFDIKSLEPRKIKIRFLVNGKYQLLIDGKVKEIFDGDAKKIRVPEGEHSVVVLLLQKKD